MFSVLPVCVQLALLAGRIRHACERMSIGHPTLREGDSMSADSKDPVAASIMDSVPNELSARRTGMAFQRTRLSAERTLMAIIRTSLSLISFGFAIFQFFGQLVQAGMIPATGTGVRDFGLTLALVGIALLIAGIAYHLVFMHGLRDQRTRLISAGLVHGQSAFPISMTLLVAIVLLVLGLFAVANMLFHFDLSI
jgi:putative membrane protein